jgi:membrane-bound inhibitor of C-type lysozyme
MKYRFAGLLAGVVVLTGCGDMKIKVWPFGADGPKERSREPLNASEYQCAANKRFYLRNLDGGEAVWLILPEREVRLERIGAGGTRYGKGNLVLDLATDKATLNDGASTTYADCKPATAAR